MRVNLHSVSIISYRKCEFILRTLCIKFIHAHINIIISINLIVLYYRWIFQCQQNINTLHMMSFDPMQFYSNRFWIDIFCFSSKCLKWLFVILTSKVIFSSSSNIYELLLHFTITFFEIILNINLARKMLKCQINYQKKSVSI